MANIPSDGRYHFDSILNFRDVGQHINHLSTNTDTPTKPVKLGPGLLYRSARPDSATPSDQSILTTTLGIKTILDLRTPTEHLEQSRKTSNLPSDKGTKTPGRIPQINYVDVNLNGKAYSNALLKQLTWTQTAKLYALYITGYRREAISVLGTNVMAARGLSGLAFDSLTHCRAEIKMVFDLLVQEDTYPLVVHCTQGKDRTGLVVLLVLLLCGVPVEAIEQDYALSGPELEPEREEKVREIQSIGLPESFADVEPGWAGRVVEFLEGEYEGVEAYLESCGVGARQRDAVRRILVEGT